MLSPKARNLTLDNWGIFVTVTPKVHEAVRLSESVAVQVTVVDPIGKTVPEPGLQVTWTGGWPLVADGASKWKSMPAALTVPRVTFARHSRLGAAAGGGGGGGGGVGAVGVPHEPARARQNAATGKSSNGRETRRQSDQNGQFFISTTL